MKRILFLANHYFTLYAFRRELIEKLVKEGYEVTLSIPDDPENRYFTDMGCIVVKTHIARRSLNPFKDVRLIREYIRLYRRIKPDIVFSYTVKPNIYGSIASRVTGIPQVCNITGTGEAFSHGAFVRSLVQMLYRASVAHMHRVFFQNSADRDYFLANRLVRKDAVKLIPGSGINIARFPYSPMPEDGETRFIYIGRVMGLKGVDQYIACARNIRASYPETRFYVAGFSEEGHYRNLVEKSQSEGILEYLGFRKDIDEWIRRCHCVILPSHGGEGIPNVLLESGATGRACIASRIPGCTDVITDGVTGYLFTPGNAEDLVRQVERFLRLPVAERNAMGRAAREKVVANYNRDIVIEAYMSELR